MGMGPSSCDGSVMSASSASFGQVHRNSTPTTKTTPAQYADRRVRNRDAPGLRQRPREGEPLGLSRPSLEESLLHSRLWKIRGLPTLSTSDLGSNWIIYDRIGGVFRPQSARCPPPRAGGDTPESFVFRCQHERRVRWSGIRYGRCWSRICTGANMTICTEGSCNQKNIHYIESGGRTVLVVW